MTKENKKNVAVFGVFMLGAAIQLVAVLTIFHLTTGLAVFGSW